jgi:hypothetical protein
MARPKLQIDERTVEGFARLGATNREIAGHFNCDETTIAKRFSSILIKARANRKIRLRQLQWQLAEKGNLGMLVWLGKQELGQTEKTEVKDATENKTIILKYEPKKPVDKKE